MNNRLRRRSTLALLLLAGCRDKPDSARVTGAPDSAKVVRQASAPAPPRPADVTTRPQITLTIDSIPPGARTALRSLTRGFLPYTREQYSKKFQDAYPSSADNGLFIVRANLQGTGRDDYAVAGINAGYRSVMAVLHGPDGWMVWNIANGLIDPKAPYDSASFWITRGTRQHPNGKWDAVVLKHLFGHETPTTYYWDARRQKFLAR